MQGTIRTVSELTRELKDLVESGFPFVWVRGQVSNLARAASGHLYFSLKDEQATLGAVWFKTRQRRGFDPLTGEVYDAADTDSTARLLENGMEVLAAGSLSVYGARGAYQLLVETVALGGEGRLKQEMEALKRKLAALGYFAPERKRPLPSNPLRVAVITAPGGAAIRDFLKIARLRGAGCAIRVFPTLVQGEKAPEEIAEALKLANESGWPQVIALIRGGGSAEDLQAFNDERVAQGIYSSRMPVVSGVGHEIDVTVSDLVADVRAATPTHAAQLLWTPREALAERLELLACALSEAFGRMLAERGGALGHWGRLLRTLSPQGRLERQGERIDSASRNFLNGMRGVFSRLAARQATAENALSLAAGGLLERLRAGFLPLEAKFEALDPARPLEQGYALVRLPNGAFLRHAGDVVPGEELAVIIGNGVVTVRVIAVNEEKKSGK